jgi:hypothetical protein
MKTKYRYIHFIDCSLVFKKKKTQTWLCKNNSSNNILGEIKWYSNWRQYCIFFEPTAVFNSTCLLDIADFLNQLNLGYKSKNKKAAAAQPALSEIEEERS